MQLGIDITQQIDITASPDAVFAALLEQLGPDNMRPDDLALPMTLEPWPGGRWFRDLGEGVGHYWATVQVIKPGQLLEMCGPLFMSYPAVNWVQYRLAEINGGARLTLRHQAVGPVQPEHREGVTAGWKHQLERIKARCE